jgi:outer membrane biosynthesis protein TonB
MNLLRPLAIALCFALPWLSVGAVQAAEPAAKTQGVHKPANKASTKAPTKPVAKVKPKPKPKPKAKPVSKAVAKPLPQPKIDLSLPKDMVKHLEPDLGDGPVVRKPLLPSMFPTKPESDSSPFQLNGRLISNEMQLQLRNDSRRDVEGAAIEFEFRN